MGWTHYLRQKLLRSIKGCCLQDAYLKQVAEKFKNVDGMRWNQKERKKDKEKKKIQAIWNKILNINLNF